MSLRHAVLGLIAEMDGASGYDLLKVFEISLGNVWRPGRASSTANWASSTTPG
ncbi:hypothetical protein [Actinomadura madurae]|uniref:hypothetical protein n=1 Tax=Actinomadura madurae TaxID=1993 RepID=UPI0020D25C41|nr:hypothetical protein [Actinomadura madurae]MCP9970381.1 hypothetical protein [Actinomadura madurae]MCP9982863.1 hypothetical protein [Actinomadura madurae]